MSMTKLLAIAGFAMMVTLHLDPDPSRRIDAAPIQVSNAATRDARTPGVPVPHAQALSATTLNAAVLNTQALIAPSDTASPSFLVISDIHLHGEDDQSPAITANSDSGKDLWDSAEHKIRSVLSGQAGVARPKFIIYLGDLPWHAKDPSQVRNVMENAGTALSGLRALAEQAHIPLLYVPGNNDSEDGDYGPFSDSLFRED